MSAGCFDNVRYRPSSPVHRAFIQPKQTANQNKQTNMGFDLKFRLTYTYNIPGQFIKLVRNTLKKNKTRAQQLRVFKKTRALGPKALKRLAKSKEEDRATMLADVVFELLRDAKVRNMALDTPYECKERDLGQEYWSDYASEEEPQPASSSSQPRPSLYTTDPEEIIKLVELSDEAFAKIEAEDTKENERLKEAMDQEVPSVSGETGGGEGVAEKKKKEKDEEEDDEEDDEEEEEEKREKVDEDDDDDEEEEVEDDAWKVKYTNRFSFYKGRGEETMGRDELSNPYEEKKLHEHLMEIHKRLDVDNEFTIENPEDGYDSDVDIRASLSD